MSNINCAISGITFSCEHLPITITKGEGYFHPIFALPQKKLLPLFSEHCMGHLTHTDSYLLFLAYLHSTEQVTWRQPASCSPADPATIKLIENNLRQLIEVIELTNIILLPSFTQPSFVVDSDNSLLQQVPNWILAWDKNIADFKDGNRAIRFQESVKKLENKLSYHILSGEQPKNFSHIIASWADKAAGFPLDRSEQWQRVIRSCFNSEKMFSTPLPLLKEIKAYCEENLEVGSIHFHTLYATLKEGISRHTDFLGLSSEALGYTLLPSDCSKGEAEIEVIKALATEEAPRRIDYSSDVDFLRAKLRYAVASRSTSATQTNTPDKETN